jgi:hypothetical protein
LAWSNGGALTPPTRVEKAAATPASRSATSAAAGCPRSPGRSFLLVSRASNVGLGASARIKAIRHD